MRNILRHYVFIILLALIFGLLGYFWGERNPIWGRFGDEKIYTAFAVDFLDPIKNKQLQDFYFQRIMPSVLVNLSAQMFSIPMTLDTIENIFGFFNILLTVLS